LGETIEVASPLQGAHQQRNIALAIAAAVELATHQGFPITPASIASGIRTTHWPARLEVVQLHTSTELAPPQVVVLDVAHNPAGAWALRAALRSLLDLDGPDAQPPTLIFSCLRDKPIAEMAQILFPIFDRVIFAPIHSPRATPMADLLAAAASTGTPATAASSVAEALELAESIASASTKSARPARTAPRAVVVAGSVYLVGEARALLLAGAGVPA
jgi:dihydrofolate synthase/folylpolyglutamate synthase